MDNYSFIDKLLHFIFIGNKFMKKNLFEIEKIFYLKKNVSKHSDKKHVFIIGMPRSGTTAILYFLNKTNYFKSLKYRNMPYVMAPNLLAKLIDKKSNIKKVERPHNDGVYHDLDTPEALDEVFLSSYNEDDISIEYLRFINIFLLNSNKRYLSKNNKNYLRIDKILSIFPNCKILIVFRDPIYQSNSLLKQHLNFVKLQKKNNFIEKYMNFLGHKEFGNSHVPWNKPIKYYDKNNINYWLEQWMFFYQSIYKKYKNNRNCIFVKYEGLEDPKYIKLLTDKIDIPYSSFNFKKNIENLKFDLDQNILNKCNLIYNELQSTIINK